MKAVPIAFPATAVISIAARTARDRTGPPLPTTAGPVTRNP